MASPSPARADLRDALARTEQDDHNAESAKPRLTLAEPLAKEIDALAPARAH
jgi:hypothetical protein